jgi:5-hydroxyisourate hydrolase
MKSPITTHVLDVSRGKPAAGISVTLEIRGTDGAWQVLGEGETNSDGRVLNLLPPDSLQTGSYRLKFLVADYFSAQNVAAFYPQVTIEFSVTAPHEHYHVPLLLSPFGYSTYRGS